MRSFDSLDLYPGDPILGLTDLFNADQRPDKVNLGVGIYLDQLGRLPLPQAVLEAEKKIAETPAPRGYIPIGGLPAFVQAAQKVVFGPDSPVLAESRVASVQTLGGSGALKEAADFLHGLMGARTVALSDPSWANHAAIYEGAGFEVTKYAYHDAEKHGIAAEQMLADLDGLQEGSVVILHACCHNPTGYDLTPEQWDAVVELTKRKGLVPFLDMAYQGFSKGFDEDRFAVEKFAASGQRFFVGNSFSKNFGLYGERVGALHVVCESSDEAKRVTSQLCKIIRTNYSNPPTHGAQVVALVLENDELRASWLDEVAAMRERIRTMREALAAGCRAEGVDLDFVTTQNGMFSYSGLTVEQMHRLRSEHGVYGTDDGRLCVAGLNEGNVEKVAKSIAAVLKD